MQLETSQPLLPMGTKTPWGKVVGVCWVGERFYICEQRIDCRTSDFALMPASVVEALPAAPAAAPVVVGEGGKG